MVSVGRAVVVGKHVVAIHGDTRIVNLYIQYTCICTSKIIYGFCMQLN